MRFSIIPTGVAAIAAALALAACGGHGVVPSQNLTAGNGALAPGGFAANVSPDANSPCNIQGQWYFHGACLPFNLNTTKNTVVDLGKFNPYGGIKIYTTFGPSINPPKGVNSVKAIMGDATGKGDITGLAGGKPFSAYGNGKNCIIARKIAACPGHAFVYAELYNTSAYTLKPKDTPGFDITDSHGFPGKNLCFPAVWSPATKSLPGGWNPNPNIGGKPNGNEVKIAPAANPGQLYYGSHKAVVTAGVCE